MAVLYILLISVAIYIFLIFFVTRLIIPYMGFSQPKAEKNLPTHWQAVVHEMNEVESKDKALTIAFNAVTKRHHGGYGTVKKHVSRAFGKPFEKPEGALQCNQVTFLLHSLLVNSKHFDETDIRYHFSALNCFIHQTLFAHTESGWVHVDPWGKILGAELGQKLPPFR